MNTVRNLVPLIASEFVAQHKDQMTAISFSDWKGRAQILLTSCKINPGEPLNKATEVGFDSLASNLGHRTVEEYITSSYANYGLNQSWDSLEKEVRAFNYSIYLGINGQTPEDVIEQYEVAKKTLGRIPTNPKEFYDAKISNIIEQSSTENIQLKDKVNGLSRKVQYHATRARNLEIMLEQSSRDLEIEQNKVAQFKSEIESINEAIDELMFINGLEKDDDSSAFLKLSQIGVALEMSVPIEEYRSSLDRLASLKKDNESLTIESQELEMHYGRLKDVNLEMELKVESLDNLVGNQEKLISHLKKVNPSDIDISDLEMFDNRIAELQDFTKRAVKSGNEWKKRSLRAESLVIRSGKALVRLKIEVDQLKAEAKKTESNSGNRFNKNIAIAIISIIATATYFYFIK